LHLSLFHHSTSTLHAAGLASPQIDVAHRENSEATTAVIPTALRLPDLVRESSLLRSQWNRQNAEIGGKSAASLHSSDPAATNEIGGTLLRKPRQGTILTFIMAEQDSSIGEPSWLFLLGTLLLGSAAALFHKKRA
jgi:hypothetical protein